MSAFTVALDFSICLLWILTYILVLVSTLKYKFPTISPITQLIIAPFEFSSLYLFILQGSLSLDYAPVAYLFWSLIEIVIMIAIAKVGNYSAKTVTSYLIALLVFTAIMIYLVAYRDNMLFFSYLNTLIGEVMWLIYVVKRDYPMKPLTAALFTTKLIADIIAVPVYVGEGTIAVSVMCVMLPIVDLFFVGTYLEKSSQRNRKHGRGKLR